MKSMLPVKVALVFIFLLSCFSVYAEDQCDDVDFSDKLGPVRNQGSSGWCYAFTAADLIGHHLGLTPNQQVSAVDIAAAYYLESPEDLEKRRDEILNRSEDPFREARSNLLTEATTMLAKNHRDWRGTRLSQRRGGQTALAISLLNLRSGICLESQSPSQKSEVFRNARRFLAEKLEKDNTRSMVAPIDPLLDRVLTRTLSGHNTRSSGGGGLISCDSLDYLNSKVLMDVTNALNAEAARQAGSTINRECSPRKPIKEFIFPMSVSVDEKGNPGAAMNALDMNLNQNRPVGISYNSCFLTRNYLKTAPFRSDCWHASSIVGRRRSPVSGKCEYKIRNSWGTSCQAYREDLQAGCVQGHVWVTKEELQQNLRSVNWILPRFDKSSGGLGAP